MSGKTGVFYQKRRGLPWVYLGATGVGPIRRPRGEKTPFYEPDPGDVSSFLVAGSVRGDPGLVLDLTTPGGTRAAGIYQSIPAGDFTIATRASLLANRYGVNSCVGLCLWQDATNAASGFYCWNLGYWGTDGDWIALYRYTNYQTWYSSVYYVQDVVAMTGVHLRIRRTGTTYWCDYSSDGIGWESLGSMSLAFAPSHFGVMGTIYSTGAASCRGVFGFFRYRDSNME